ncbi:MAG: Glu/Leu/Phe/Val dehydrogenase [Oligoflexales bacterium]|nr:Glu/Leu/Phe/Val dehydrogenase [Oligoflexales bacterium]
MKTMELLSTMGHEQVLFCQDKASGLKAIIAIHDTTLGPALGGCRFWNYQTEEEALFDVLRLSRGMTYKAAVAGLHLGGGKAIIMGDPATLKSEKLFSSFGRFVNSLGGRYITAEDVNTRVEDVEQIAKETKYVTGLSKGSGDPSPITALGVFFGIKAAVSYKLKRHHLKGIRVAVQGCGAVGRSLCRLLHADGAELFVSDINPLSTQQMALELGAKEVAPEETHKLSVDVYSPCALGAALNKKSIPEIKAAIVAGAANNQLLDEEQDGRALQNRGILYAPDYVINAGGLINVAHELAGYNEKKARADAEKIFETMLKIFKIAEDKRILTHEASNELAQSRIAEVRKQREGKHLLHAYGNQSWIHI